MTTLVIGAILFVIVVVALQWSQRMREAEAELIRYLGNGGEWYGLELVDASAAHRGRIRRGEVYVILAGLEDRELVTSREVAGRRLYRLATVPVTRVDKSVDNSARDVESRNVDNSTSGDVDPKPRPS